jgi:hypothetical protein
MSSTEVLLTNDDLIVIGGPETLNVELDFGPKGDRGSLIFVGNQQPPNDVEDFSELVGQTPKVFDLYINLLKADPDNEYLMIYQYLPTLIGDPQWETLTKLIPNTYSGNVSIDFNTSNYCHIPIAAIVDPAYVGNTDASNFSVQVTFSTSAAYPIVSSIKTEIVSLNSIQNLKITFYAKEFDGTNWVDITGPRTANLHISVV